MKKEELQKLVTELQDICDSRSSKKDPISNLIRLSTCMGKLKSYPKYSTVADEMLDMIGTYDANDPFSLELIIAHTELLISFLNDDLEKGSIPDSLKMGYEEAKNRIDAIISDDVKDACKGKAIEVKDVCKETAGQAKNMCRKAEKIVKFKLRNWLLADDDK